MVFMVSLCVVVVRSDQRHAARMALPNWADWLAVGANDAREGPGDRGRSGLLFVCERGAVCAAGGAFAVAYEPQGHRLFASAVATKDPARPVLPVIHIANGD